MDARAEFKCHLLLYGSVTVSNVTRS